MCKCTVRLRASKAITALPRLVSRLRRVDDWAGDEQKRNTCDCTCSRICTCYQVLSPCKCTPHKSLRQSEPGIHAHTRVHTHTSTHRDTHKDHFLPFFVSFSLYIYNKFIHVNRGARLYWTEIFRATHS